jgi:hypothetical protein
VREKRTQFVLRHKKQKVPLPPGILVSFKTKLELEGCISKTLHIILEKRNTLVILIFSITVYNTSALLLGATLEDLACCDILDNIICSFDARKY